MGRFARQFSLDAGRMAGLGIRTDRRQTVYDNQKMGRSFLPVSGPGDGQNRPPEMTR